MSAVPALWWTFVLADSDRMGGSERRLTDLVPLLLAAGDHLDVHTLTRPGRLTAQRLRAAGAPVQVMRGPLCAHPDGAPHVVVTFGHRAGLATRARRHRLGPQCRLWQAQTGLDPGRSRLVRAADRLTRSAVDLVVANSQAAADLVVVAPGFRHDRVVVIEPALPDAWTRPVPKRDGPPATVAMIGSDRPLKNLAAGVRVFARLADADARLVVYTDTGDAVRAAAARLGVAHRTTIHCKRIVEPADHAGFSALLHPSLSESLPRVVLEAVAQGTPVAAFDVGDTARWVAEAAPPGDETALLGLLERALAGTLPLPLRAVRTTPDYARDLREQALHALG